MIGEGWCGSAVRHLFSHHVYRPHDRTAPQHPYLPRHNGRKRCWRNNLRDQGAVGFRLMLQVMAEWVPKGLLGKAPVPSVLRNNHELQTK